MSAALSEALALTTLVINSSRFELIPCARNKPSQFGYG